MVERPNDYSDDVLRAIRRIVRRISSHSHYLAREVGLTVPQLLCLKAIGNLEQTLAEVTVAQVAKRVQLSAATTSRIIDRLERADLVLRERNSKDRRRVCLSLTPGGYERFETLPKPLQDRFVDALDDLDEQERRTILASLERVAALMGAEDIDASPVLTPGEDVKSET